MGHEAEKRGELRAEERLMEATASQMGPLETVRKVGNAAICHQERDSRNTTCDSARSLAGHAGQQSCGAVILRVGEDPFS